MALLPISTIEEVQFSILGGDENLLDSYVEVTNKDLFRQSLPIPNGIYDARMGTTEHKWRCQSCHNTKVYCPGHEGHITLNYPVQSPMFRDDIIQWLKVVCFTCGNLLIDRISLLAPLSAAKKLGEYVKMTRSVDKNVRCPSCKAVHPHIVRDKNRSVTIWAEFYDGNKITARHQLFNHAIAEIFDRIPAAVVTALGKSEFAHPRKLILRIIRVPPNTVRPDIKQVGGGGRSNNNDLTTLAKAIVEINNALPVIIPETISETLEVNYTNQDMAYHELVKGTPGSSGKNKITTNTNRAPGSLASRFPQKSGRIRRNLMGARVWYTARTVITCDPMLRVDELGIPIDIAREIQIPEAVNARNRSRLTVYFNNKRDLYPGATKVQKRATGVEHWVGALNRDFVLEDGDVLMRDVINGDVVIFNRQPSLLGPSMSCHRAVILTETKTLGMNISACALYAADFDGDAMNIFFARSVQTRTEISVLANVGNCFISKKTGEPMIGALQDTLAGLVEMTRSDIVVSRFQAMEIFKMVPAAARLLTANTYTGRELFSMLLPAINFKTKAMFYNQAYAPYLKYKTDEVDVVIERGILRQGVIDQNTVGEGKSNSIFHTIHNEYGPTAALSLIFDVKQVAMEFVYNRGFTVGIDDITISSAALSEIQFKTSALIAEASRITQKLRRGEIIAPIGMTVADFYEGQQVSALSLADDFVEPIISNIDTNRNGLYKMIQMCKKGKMKNFQAITSAIGSTLVNGSRANTNFGYKRTLPYFLRFDSDPMSNGFVPDSYMTGQSPESFVFQAQEARFSVINKALSTSITGHQNREAIKNMETVLTDNVRRSVKNSAVIQFLYGGVGIDVRRVEVVAVPTVMLGDTDLREKYLSTIDMFEARFKGGASASAGSGIVAALEGEFAQLVADRDLYRAIFLRVEAMYTDRMMTGRVQSTVNIQRIVDDTIYDFRGVGKEHRIVNPSESLEMVEKFCAALPYIYLNSGQEQARGVVAEKYRRAIVVPLILVRSHLNTRALLRGGVSIKMLGLILDKVRFTMRKALIDYGTAVGILSAQSISEPMSQYIISSHHRSGVTGGTGDSQTDMLTRSKEVLLAKTTEKMRSPTMTLYVGAAHEGNSTKVGEIANHIENMRLKRFVAGMQIFFEDYGVPIHPSYIHEGGLVRLYESHNPNVVVPSDLTKWVVRLELDRLGMILKNMDLETIVFALVREFPKIHVVYSAENADVVVVRCYVRNSMFKRGHIVSQKDVEDLKDVILDTVVRGANGVYTAVVVKGAQSYVDAGGEVKTRPIYIIKTNGTNVAAMLENSNLDVDRIQTNSIKEVEEVYGIEAARQKLRLEIEKISPGLNQAHYSLYADEMCYTGRVTGVSKTGLDKREPRNVLLRASYSFTTTVLKAAAVGAQNMRVGGISTPLMLGRSPYVGSTYNTVAVDYDFVRRNVESIGNIIEGL